MGGGSIKKIAIICVILLSMNLFFNIFAIAGYYDDPEIEDTLGDAFGYLDIHSVWSYENEENPDILYVSMKISEPVYWHFQQTFGIFWNHNDKLYSCGLHLGFGFGENWERYSAGHYPPNKFYDEYHYNLSGTYSLSDGIITWELQKEFIGKPQKGDVLSKTWSNAFRRVGIIGRIGFTRYIIDDLIYIIFGNSMWDYAPNKNGGYGRDYVIQY
jgi:hypothetical protein